MENTPPPASPKATDGSEKPKGNGDHKSPSQTQKINFGTLPNTLRKIILDLESNYKVLKRVAGGVEINRDLLEKSKDIILDGFEGRELALIKHLYLIPHEWLSYRTLLNNFNFFFPEEEIASDHPTNISTAKKKSDSEEEKGGSRGRSHPPSPLDRGFPPSTLHPEDSRILPPDRAKISLKKGKESFGIWISTNKLDHARTWIGKYDLDDPEVNAIWEKLEKNLKVNYNNTGWAYPIREKDGYILKVHVHKNNFRNIGTVRIFVERHFDLMTIFQDNYFRIFDFFTPEEHGLFLNALEDEATKNPLFYVELANAMGPKSIVDDKFKKAHLKCYLHDGLGKKTWIDVEIDYSIRQPEIEFRGPFFPTSNLRDVVVEPGKYVDSVLFMNSNIMGKFRCQGRILDEINENVSSNGQVLLQVSSKLDYVYNDITGLLTKQEILQDLHFLNLESYLKGTFNQGIAILNGVNQNVGLLGQSLQNLFGFVDAGFGEIRETVSSQVEPIIDSLSLTVQKQEETHEKIDELRKDVIKRLDDLEASLKETLRKELSELRKAHFNNLYLVLKAIKDLPGATSREIVEALKDELKVSRSTIYNYLKTLQDKGLVEKSKKRSNKKGRPSHSFWLSKRTKNLIKKIKELRKGD